MADLSDIQESRGGIISEFGKIMKKCYATPFSTLIIKQANRKAKINNSQGRIEPGSSKT